MVGMVERTSTFSLRLRNPRVRALLREVADREHISQNELIEQALEHELSLRGARLAEDLAAAAKRLSELSDAAYVQLIDDSIDSFVAGEAEPEPLPAYALHESGPAESPPAAGPAPSGSDPLGVLAAFESGRR
jgi:hypothetical protein